MKRMDQAQKQAYAARIGEAAKQEGIELTNYTDPSFAEFMSECRRTGVKGDVLLSAAE